MGVKKGYKQTEVGVIPEDWEVVAISRVVDKLESGVSVKSVEKTQYNFAHNKAVLKTSCVFHGKFFPEENKAILPSDLHRAKCSPKSDTILVSRMNTLELVAECGYVILDYPNLFLPDRLWMTQHSNQKELSVRWLAYLLSSPLYNRSLKESASGTSGSMKNLSKFAFFKTLIPIPPTKAEQTAIAEALSDEDALIESLGRLIGKKRQIKQGAMQELLTGKRRLPGFSGEWEVRTLLEVSNFIGGKAHEQYISDEGNYVCVNSKFISTDGKVRKFSTANFSCAKLNDVLMVMSDLPNGKALAKTFLVDQDHLYAINQRVCAFRPFNSSCGKFLSYFLNRNPYFLKFDDGVSQTHLLNRVFENCQLTIPPTKEEQTAIANILSDMDEEIAALETKLTKARQIKQAMMQELLTGKIRLI